MRWKRDPDTLQRVEDLEVQAVNAAEKGTLEDASELLHRAFAEAPNHSSPCDNGAQVSTQSRNQTLHTGRKGLSMHLHSSCPQDGMLT